eukprot:3871721-Rhodomonas_salina.2
MSLRLCCAVCCRAVSGAEGASELVCCCVLLRVVSVTEHVLVRCNVRCPGLSVVRLWDAVRCPRASMGWDEAVQCLWLSVCGGGKVDTDLAVEFKLRAQDVHSKDDPSGPSLAQALAPLDDEQTALNHRREMLYFRMETNIHPVQQPVLTRGYGAMP